MLYILMLEAGNIILSRRHAARHVSSTITTDVARTCYAAYGLVSRPVHSMTATEPKHMPCDSSYKNLCQYVHLSWNEQQTTDHQSPFDHTTTRSQEQQPCSKQPSS